MLASDESAVRVRGFRLLCKQACWDRDAKLSQAIDVILDELDDEKPTAVRQAILALGDVVRYKPGLCDQILAKLLSLDPHRYKDSMSGLIAKDIQSLLTTIGD